MKKSEVIELILICFPHWNHFDWNGEDPNFHFGEFDHKGSRHADSIYVIRFTAPSSADVIQFTIFKDGIHAWNNSRPLPLFHQFAAHNFLKNFFPEIV